MWNPGPVAVRFEFGTLDVCAILYTFFSVCDCGCDSHRPGRNSAVNLFMCGGQRSVHFNLCVRACVCVLPVAQDKSVISATNDAQLADYFLGLLRDSTYAIR